MQNKLKRNKLELMLLIILIILNGVLGLIIKSSITNYSFSVIYLPELLKNFDKSFIMLNMGCFILLLYIFIILLTNRNIESYSLIVSKWICIISILLSFSLNLIIGYKSIYKTECVISGNSMYPTISSEEKVTLKYGKKILLENIIVFEVNSKYFDMDSNNPEYYIKRVIGLPGDEIEYSNNKLYRNGLLINEVYLSNESFSERSNDFNGLFKYKKNGSIIETTIIPSGYCFVMGDNRKVDKNGKNQSFDSREIGLVPFSCILGIVEI